MESEAVAESVSTTAPGLYARDGFRVPAQPQGRSRATIQIAVRKIRFIISPIQMKYVACNSCNSMAFETGIRDINSRNHRF
jgi:hypothetical protein